MAMTYEQKQQRRQEREAKRAAEEERLNRKQRGDSMKAQWERIRNDIVLTGDAWCIPPETHAALRERVGDELQMTLLGAISEAASLRKDTEQYLASVKRDADDALRNIGTGRGYSSLPLGDAGRAQASYMQWLTASRAAAKLAWACGVHVLAFSTEEAEEGRKQIASYEVQHLTDGETGWVVMHNGVALDGFAEEWGGVGDGARHGPRALLDTKHEGRVS